MDVLALSPGQNADERDLVAMCVQNVAKKYPVSVAKPRAQTKAPVSTPANGKV
jgi:hypothetical protein